MAALTEQGSIAVDGTPTLSWAAIWRPKTAGLPCGDRHLARRIGGAIMLAVIDGSGSGVMAAEAAEMCHGALVGLEGATTLEDCFTAGHDACRGTSGVAMGVAIIDPAASRLTWGAVGDIDVLLFRASGGARNECILQCGGTLGLHLPAVLTQTHRIGPGDTLIFVSDGIRRGYRGPGASGLPVMAVAQEVMRLHGRAVDDAIVLAARFGAP